MSVNLQVDQAIYGYRDGHRLLQASCKLDGPSERVLLTLSDMSGSRMQDGFEEYISGFPIPGTDSYALAKTWYAPEMERPGCVWTHVLIVTSIVLNEVGSLSQLSAHFRRPEERRPGGYQAMLSITSTEIENRSADITLGDATQIIATLYGKPEKPVIMAASNSGDYEELVAAVWSQQWPQLRAAFSFCTGSLANRVLSGRSFDLQIVPHRVAREFAKSPNSFTLLQTLPADSSSWDTRESTSSWEVLAASDLGRGARGTFRRFLWQYADQTSSGRKMYRRLAQVYLRVSRVSDDTGTEELKDELQRQFPRAAEGRKLKRALYGDLDGAGDTILPRLPESERLLALTSPLAVGFFNFDDFAVGTRVCSLWQSDVNAAKNILLKLLDHSSSHPVAREALQAFADSIAPGQLCSLAKARPTAFPTMVAMNPKLAATEEFWICDISQHVYDDVLDALLRQDRTAIDLWLPAAIRVAPGTVAVPVFTRFGWEAARGLLDYFENGPLKTIPEAWKNALLTRQQDILNWYSSQSVSPRLKTLSLLASLLDPQAVWQRLSVLEPWRRLAMHVAEYEQTQEGVEAAFLLALGFETNDPGSLDLVLATFERVHDLAATQRLGYRSWQHLQPLLPHLSGGQEWDRCERLRRGLLKQFLDHHWPTEQLLQCVKNPGTFALLVKGTVDFAFELMQALATDVAGGRVVATSAQSRILSEEIARRKGFGEIIREFFR